MKEQTGISLLRWLPWAFVIAIIGVGVWWRAAGMHLAAGLLIASLSLLVVIAVVVWLRFRESRPRYHRVDD